MFSKNIFAPALLCGLSALFLLGLSGCGSSTPPPIAVAITAPNGTQSIDQAQTVAITASVQTTRRMQEWRGAFRVAAH